MENKLLKTSLENWVLKSLEGNDFLTSEQIVNELDKYCDDCEDLDELIDIIFNSKRYNVINCANGLSYIFGMREIDILDFIETANIPDNDTCWLEYITCDGRSYQLNYFVKDV